jgi:two-component system cell cycle sensor histidine kinase/response regulator CckA
MLTKKQTEASHEEGGGLNAVLDEHPGWANAGLSFAADLEPDRPKTILVVEDENAVRGLVKMLLEMNGYRVLDAQSSVEAMTVWAEHADQIDVLITDMILPGKKNGGQLARELHALKPTLKIILASGYSQNFISPGFVLKEGVNFLQKPYGLKKLIGTLRACLDAKQ